MQIFQHLHHPTRFLFFQPYLHFFKRGNTNFSSQSTFVNKATVFVFFIEIYNVCHFSFLLSSCGTSSNFQLNCGGCFEHANFYMLLSFNFEVSIIFIQCYFAIIFSKCILFKCETCFQLTFINLF